MKKFIKRWLLPPNILKLLVQIFTIFVQFVKQSNYITKKNIRYKNIHKGKRCFILGNGPSVKTIDLSILFSEDVILMSNFYLHQDYKKINPKYHVVVKVYDNLIPITDQVKWYKDMEKNVKCEAIFFNFDQYPIIKKEGLFSKFNLNFIATAQIMKRKFDISKVSKHYRTGPIKCLDIAMYMGYEEIYLLGVELDTFCSKKYSYFFDRKDMKTNDKNIKEGDSVKANMTELLYNNWLTYTDFVEIEKKAKRDGVKIYNLSTQSRLDMFEKRDIDRVLYK